MTLRRKDTIQFSCIDICLTMAGGTCRTSKRQDHQPRETGRFEIRHVPAAIRERDRVIGETRTPVLKKYERICFEKHAVRQYGKPMGDLIHPSHPLMHATIDLVLQAHRQKLKQGSVMVYSIRPEIFGAVRRK